MKLLNVNEKGFEKMKFFQKKIIIPILMLVCIQLVYADQVIVNSDKWEDVYSGMLYASLKNDEGYFLTSEQYGSYLLTILKEEPITLIESPQAYVANYESSLESKDLIITETIKDSALNLELANKLKVKNYIIVDSTYGYNAISVAPYAILTDSYVLLVSKDNQNNIIDFLDSQDINNLLVYGQISRSFRDKLAKYAPEIIDTGSKFDDNMEIVKKFLEKQSTSQVTLTHGQFIEKGMFTEKYPTLFIALKNTPDEVTQFAKQNSMKYAVVIGNELADSARELKKQAGMASVLLKYAQGTPSDDAFAEVKALDMFFVPAPKPNIDITNINYNTVSKAIEVTYSNIGDPAYARASISIYDEDDALLKSAGENSPFLLEGEIGRQYSLDLTQEIAESKDLKVIVLLSYGIERNALELELTKEFTELKITEIEDNSKIEFVSLNYDKKNKELQVKVKNTGTTDAYAKADVTITILDAYGEEEDINFASETKLVKAELEETLRMKAVLDLSTITKAKVRLSYGARENLLLRSALVQEAEIQKLGFTISATGIAVIIAIVFVGLIVFILGTKALKRK